MTEKKLADQIKNLYLKNKNLDDSSKVETKKFH